jgi:hypothetical protein
MNDDVDIGLLSTRIRSTDAAHAQALAGQVHQLADRQLAKALEGAGSRALASARLPAGAVVAVQRLDLHLKVAADVPGTELATGWAAAFEAGLCRLLATVAPGDVDDDASVAWFADAWAAERRHLERRLAGMGDAWWAPDLAGDDDGADPLAPILILQRWLRRNPARTVTTLAELARADARVATLLSPGEAASFTLTLLRQMSLPGTARATSSATGLTASDTLNITGQIDALPAHLQAACARIALHRQGLAAAAGNTALSAPWLAALLLAEAPSASNLPVETLAQLVTQLATTATTPAGSAGMATGQRTADPAVPQPALSNLDPVCAGGLLLLLRPLLRLDRLPGPAQLGSDLGELALTALRRVFAPLPPGERAVAEERERPLLAVFAPECDWSERISLMPIRDPAAADALLDALVAAIPIDIAAAPGAMRQVFGARPAAFPTGADTRLARLLLRPGMLSVTPWAAELAWPLTAIDLALRRAGWDQDPGWLPWLGRSVRFRFGDPS